MNKKISIIIPAYNEELLIESTINKIYSDLKYWRKEVVVVDDGSTDNTYNILRKLQKKHRTLRVITLAENEGKGYAVRQGLMFSYHEIKLLLDADYSCDVGLVKTVYNTQAKKQPQHWIIKGHRIQVEPQPFYRIVVGKCWKFLVFVKTGLWMDTQCPCTLMKLPKNFYIDLKIDGFAFDVEILQKAKQMGISIMSIAVAYRNCKDSKVTLRKTWDMFIDLMKLG